MYHLGIGLYWIVAAIYGLFNPKAREFVKGRRNWITKLKTSIPKDCRPVWFHCASLGEFEQGRPLIEAYHRRHPDRKILLSFFSPSGYTVRKNYSFADWVFYLPLDTFWNARRWINIVNPSEVFFIKYEYWFNFLHCIHRKNIPCYIVSAIFMPEQAFFKWYGGPFRWMLGWFTRIFVQNQSSESQLKTIGINSATVCGDTRFDRVADSLTVDKTPENLKHFMQTSSADSLVLAAGSTWPQDEEILVKCLDKFPGLCIVMAPHEIHSQHIDFIEHLFASYNPVFLSRVEGREIPKTRILVVDAIGILSSLYRHANLAYIGGGFNPSGIHNSLEAATYGKALIFGPHYSKFQEAKDLVAIGSAKAYTTEEELISIISLWQDASLYTEAGDRAKDYVQSHLGATGKILNAIESKN